jgi:hypothetical protein
MRRINESDIDGFSNPLSLDGARPAAQGGAIAERVSAARRPVCAVAATPARHTSTLPFSVTQLSDSEQLFLPHKRHSMHIGGKD